MTVVAIWYRKAQGDLYAIADSRLTSSLGVLTDRAPKFFALNVSCQSSGQSQGAGFEGQVALGYAGSATVALSTVATVQTYLTALSLPDDGKIPKLSDLADLVGSVLKDNFASFGALWEQNAKCDFLLFGQMPLDPYLTCFHITADRDDTDISSKCSELPLVEKELCCSFGSASSFFMSELEKDMEATGNFHPFDMLKGLLRSGKRPDIGGDIQVAIAGRGRVTLPLVITPRLDRGEFQGDVTFLGRELGKVGDCSIGREAVGPDAHALERMRREAGF